MKPIVLLSKSDLQVNINKILSLLVEKHLSFTVFNITQIMRYLHINVRHGSVREYFADTFKVPDNYRKFHVVVDENQTNAVLYTPINFDLPEDFFVHLDASNFTSLIAEYIDWFVDEYGISVSDLNDSLENEDGESLLDEE